MNHNNFNSTQQLQSQIIQLTLRSSTINKTSILFLLVQVLLLNLEPILVKICFQSSQVQHIIDNNEIILLMTQIRFTISLIMCVWIIATFRIKAFNPIYLYFQAALIAISSPGAIRIINQVTNLYGLSIVASDKSEIELLAVNNLFQILSVSIIVARFKIKISFYRTFYIINILIQLPSFLAYNQTKLFDSAFTLFALSQCILITMGETINYRHKYFKQEQDQLKKEIELQAQNAQELLAKNLEQRFQEELSKNNELTKSRGNELINKLRIFKFRMLINKVKQNKNESDEKTPAKLNLACTFNVGQLKKFKNGKKPITTPSHSKKLESIEEDEEFQTPKRSIRNIQYNNNEDTQKHDSFNDSAIFYDFNLEDIDDLIKMHVYKSESYWLPEILQNKKAAQGNLSNETKEYLLDHFSQHQQQSNVISSSQVREVIDLKVDFQELSVDKKYQSMFIDFNLNLFQMTDSTKCRQFLDFTNQMLIRFNILQQLKVPLNVANEFFFKIQRLYLANPYHNYYHALDVTNSIAFFLNKGINVFISSFYQANLLISSIAHDVGHPGLNNGFLVTTKSKQALIYNDQSVLENIHTSILFQILSCESSNIIQNLSDQDQKIFRKTSISLILETDLQKHFQIVNKLKTMEVIQQKNEIEEESLRFNLMSLMLKAADVGHGAKSLDLHKIWSRRIIEEFYLQGDQENKHGIGVTPLCDRKAYVGQSQEGFLKFIVLPLYETLEQITNLQFIKKECIQQIQQNQEYWLNIKKEEEEQGKNSFLEDTANVLKSIEAEAAEKISTINFVYPEFHQFLLH